MLAYVFNHHVDLRIGKHLGDDEQSRRLFGHQWRFLQRDIASGLNGFCRENWR